MFAHSPATHHASVMTDQNSPRRSWSALNSKSTATLGMMTTLLALTTRATHGDGDARGHLHEFRTNNALRDGDGDEALWMAQARSFIGYDAMSGTEPLFGGTHQSKSFDWSEPRLSPQGHAGAVGMFQSPMQPVINPVRNALHAARDVVGLRSDIYEAMSFSAVSDTLENTRTSAAAARFNARADLLLFRNVGEGIGVFTAQVRQNNRWPAQGANLSASVGSPSDINELESGVDTKLARLQYSQSVLDDRVKFTIGKLNPNDYIAMNIFASDEVTQFLAQPFDGNDVLPMGFQNYTEGVALQSLLTDWLYFDGVFASAAGGNDAMIEIDFASGFAAMAEIGVLLDLERAGIKGQSLRISAAWAGANTNSTLVSQNASPDIWGNGLAFTAQYFVRPEVGMWAQAAVAEEDVASTATSQIAVGLTFDNCFGRVGDGFGVAMSWTDPLEVPDGAPLGHEGLFETFYRMQVTGTSQLSLDAQLLLPAADSRIDDATIVGTVRWVFRF